MIYLECVHLHIREKAEVLVREFGFNEPPVDLSLIAEKLGIEVVEMALPLWFFGVLLNVSGDYYVVLNKSMPKVRKIFTLAHEIAHLLLHKTELCYMKNNKRDYYHRDADIFAAELCMPSFMVQKEVEINPNRGHKHLAKVFRVGERAMEILLRAFVPVTGSFSDRRFRVPKVDVKCLDLLDQQEDRPACGSQLVALGLHEPRAPAPELIDLVFVEAPAQDPSSRPCLS